MVDLQNWKRRVVRTLAPSRGLILMYHRVASLAVDPWGLAVHPDRFIDQIAILKKHTQLIPLRGMALALQRGNPPDRAVAITFDDGYADNLYQAQPILDFHEVPATVFVASGYTGKSSRFWWDELERICFQAESLPKRLDLTIRGKSEQWELGEVPPLSRAAPVDDNRVRAWEAGPGTRMNYYYRLWKKLQPLPVQERENAIGELAAWANYPADPPTKDSPMTPRQLIELESGGWIEIGAHTVHHLDLTTQPNPVKIKEIMQCKTDLEQWLNHPVQTFSYPFGKNCRTARLLVREAGFACACTTAPRIASSLYSPYRLPRTAISDWDGPTFEQKIKQWFAN